MKKIIFLTLFAACSLLANAQEFIRPTVLKPGDKIAIISPASAPDPSYIKGAEAVLEKWGYSPVISKNAYAKSGTFAGTIAQRLEDLKWAFENPEIKAILCTRGGYGSIQELCEIEPGYFAKHPKWLIGYSDITSIHSALSSDRVTSIHAHMCEHLADTKGLDSCSIALKAVLEGAKMDFSLPDFKLNKPGTARGRLVGGNFAVLSRLAGSRIDYLSNTDEDIILFIEDVNESIERVNSMLYRLKIAGVLSKIKGLVVGDFKGAKATPDFNSVEELVNNVMQGYNIPICYKFPTGHTDINMPLIVGEEVTLTVTSKGATLK